MNYENIYKSLINNAQNRAKPDVYCERHHILPTCLGGKDVHTNMVWLTAREHMLAHILIAKYTNHRLAIYSAHIMVNRYGNGKNYQWVRAQFAENHPNKNPTFRAMMSELMTGRYVSPETCKKLSERDMWWCTGVPSGMTGKHQPESAKAAISAKMSGDGNPMAGKFHDSVAIGKMSGKNHRKSKNWVVTSPNGVVYEFVGGLDKFCNEHGLQPDIFKKSAGQGKIKKARAGCLQSRIDSEGWMIDERK